MQSHEKYFERYGITHPAYNASRIAGRHIRDRASEYFSGRLLEIGAGSKIKGLLVGEFVDEHVGLDIAASPHYTENLDIIGSALDMPIDDEEFDCALSTAVLEHLEDPQRALNEAYRILKPGAHAIYTMPLFWHLHEEPRDFFRYTKHGLQHLFTSAGFEVVELKPLSGFILTFGTELAYYLRRFKRGRVSKRLVDLVTVLINLIAPRLDQLGSLRDEKFTWMYLVVARKPVSQS